MRKAVLFIFSFVVHISTYSQTDTTVVPMAAYWETGDNYSFKVTRIKRTWNDKKLTHNDSIQYTASFRVLKSDSISYTIKWSFKNYFFDVFGLPEYSRAVFPNYENTHVVYRTDQFGAFTGIENWQEIHTMINDLVNEQIQVHSSDTSVNIEQLKRSLQPLLAVYGTQKGIEQLVFEELMIFHFPFGKQYTRGQLYPYKEKIPVMVNAEPVTGNGIIFLRNVDLEKQKCEIVQRMEVHPDTARHMLSIYFRNMGMKPEAIGSAVHGSTLNIMENNVFVYDYYSGIPEKLSARRATEIDVLEDKVKQIDITLIERVDN